MSAREEAIGKLAKVADDWGWSPSQMKPGEISGTRFGEFLSDESGLYDRDYAYDNWTKYNDALNYAHLGETINNDLTKTMGQVYKQLDASKYSSLRPQNKQDVGSMLDNMRKFEIMETIGVPRKWTGKVLNAFLQVQDYQRLTPNLDINAENYDYVFLQQMSDILRPMTNDQRQTFLNLLPKWTGTLETAASAAKKLYRR
jgi:hypothetical protein